MSDSRFEIDVAGRALRTAMLASDVAKRDEIVDDDRLFIGPDGSVPAETEDPGACSDRPGHRTTGGSRSTTTGFEGASA